MRTALSKGSVLQAHSSIGNLSDGHDLRIEFHPWSRMRLQTKATVRECRKSIVQRASAQGIVSEPRRCEIDQTRRTTAWRSPTHERTACRHVGCGHKRTH